MHQTVRSLLAVSSDLQRFQADYHRKSSRAAVAVDFCLNPLEDVTRLADSNIVQRVRLCNYLIFPVHRLFIPACRGTFVADGLYYHFFFFYHRSYRRRLISSSLSTKEKRTVTPQGVPSCRRHLTQPKHTSSYVEPSIMHRVNGITFICKEEGTVAVELFLFLFPLSW